MKKTLVSLVIVGGIAALPAAASAAVVCPSGQAPGVAPLYCVPPPSRAGSDLAPVTQAAAKALAKLTPARLLSKGGVSVSATLPGAGSVTVTISEQIGGHTVVLGKGTATATGANPTALKVTLSKAGRAALGKHKGKGKLKLKVTVAFKPADGGAATTLTGKASLK